MKIRYTLLLMALMMILLVGFVPGTVFAPEPAAAGSGPVSPLVPPGSCDLAQFVADITVPDGTILMPGQPFSKTWRIINLSSCTWNPSYSMVFVSGAQMEAPAAVNFPDYVAPGATIDLSVNMNAPTAPGRYIGYWKLRDDVGIIFGLGPNHHITFFVNIRVRQTGVNSSFSPSYPPYVNYWMYPPVGYYYFNGVYWQPWPGPYAH